MLTYLTSKGGLKNITICEDSLTASVFDLLKYLPQDLMFKLLKNSLIQNKLPGNPGSLHSISFWDKWNSKGTGNSKFVEPDIFLRFENLDIIIEAKRYDYNQQNPDQLGREVISYYNEYGAELKELYFIQIGGLNNLSDEPNFILQDTDFVPAIICKTTWSKILDNVSYLATKYSNLPTASYSHIVRLLDDIIISFELHQFYKLSWLKEIEYTHFTAHTFPTLPYLKPKKNTGMSFLKSSTFNFTTSFKNILNVKS